ncbi:MAG: pilus assembly PilX N-terminal domain-containing protein [Halioglobus sp.]
MIRIASIENQSGVVLVVSLIMLLAVTLMVVSASNMVQTDLKIVANMESREKARQAALAALEEAMSSLRFSKPAEPIFKANCGQVGQKCYDYNGDSNDDVVVTLLDPLCVSVIPLKNSELDVYNNPSQATCFLPPAVYSMCANAVWELQATAIDAQTGAEVTVRQGVSVMTTTNDIDDACPTT